MKDPIESFCHFLAIQGYIPPRNEEELLAKQANPQEYNDFVIYPDKVRINLFYLKHYSFIMDIMIIIATVTGKRISYNNEII